MLSIIVSGCNGYMGKVISDIAKGDPDITVVAGFDVNIENPGDYPVYADPAEYTGAADAVIDFSNPSALDGLIAFGLSRKTPLVLCTTGYSPGQNDLISKTSEAIPVFRSGNMSLGVNLLVDLVKRACLTLGSEFDVEIVERHHRRKVDAPSGTALMLADAAAQAMDSDPDYVFSRQSRNEPRGGNEIGISSVRGGTIVGQHDVIFAGPQEVIELRHSAFSRDVFAVGAIRAAKFIANVSAPGLYDMSCVLA